MLGQRPVLAGLSSSACRQTASCSSVARSSSSPSGQSSSTRRFRLPVVNVERDDPGFAVVGAFEPFGGVDELGLAGRLGGEPEDCLVGDRDPCEPHRLHTRSCRALPLGVQR